MKSTRWLISCAFLISSTSIWALHANRKIHRFDNNDKVSHGIVKIISDGGSSCTGSFFTKRVIITAAHCVDGYIKGEGINVLSYRGSEPARRHEFSGLSIQVKAYDNYDFSEEADVMKNVPNDLALIYLPQEIEEAHPAYFFDDMQKRETMAEYINARRGQLTYVAGTGSRQRLVPGVNIYDHLRSLLKHTTNRIIGLEEGVLRIESSQGTKVCKGDSGGPMYHKSTTGEMIQYGVASVVYTGVLWAKNCGRNAFYVGLTNEKLDWIEQSVLEFELSDLSDLVKGL